MDLSNRTAVITGASRGLGAGLARDFQRRGLRLGLCSRSDPALKTGEGVLAAQVDVVDSEALSAFAGAVEERFGAIDLWINNAGVLDPIAPLRELSTAQFSAHLAINLTGVLHGTQAFIHHLRRSQSFGVLINISSGAARKGYAGWTAYCASKAGVDRLTECVQLEEGRERLRALSVAPGIIDTDMQELIRGCSKEQFPEVERFRQLKADEAFNTCEFVAEHLLALAFDPDRADEPVVTSLPYNP